MKQTELLGTEPLTMGNWFELYLEHAMEIKTFLSQPFTIDMVIRPEKPKYILEGVHIDTLSGEEIGKAHEMDLKNQEEWQNWQPVFLGEWQWIDDDLEYITVIYDGKYDCLIDKGQTLNEFITEWPYRIKLEYNPNREL